MRNLFKCTLGVLAAVVASAALASAASAASPALSPVPGECGSCVSEPFTFTLGGASANMHSDVGEWKYDSSSGEGFVSSGGEFLGVSHLTFNNASTGGCKNEANNFTVSELRGALGFVPGGTVGLNLESKGSVFAKCTQSGTPAEVTGSIIGAITPTNEPSTSFRVGYTRSGTKQNLTVFEGEEALRHLSIANGGGSPVELGVEATETMTTSVPVELNTTGGTSRFITNPEGSKPTGGFLLTGGLMIFQSKNGLEVKCKAEWGTGEFTSATGGHASLRFTGCTGPLGVKCNNGEIKTPQLNALLAYTYPAKETAEGRETGVVLTPATGAGGVFAEFTCAKVTSVVRGSVLAPISPLAKASNTFALTLKQSKARQAVTAYEASGGGMLEANLETSTAGGKWELSGLEVGSPTVQLDGGAVETIK